MSLDWHGIADRIRGLIRLDATSDVAAIAARLAVPELSLRATVDGRAPLPTPAVISALVRVYGLDPSWVLTGVYDSGTHRLALQSDRVELDALVRRLIVDRLGGPMRDVAWHPDLHAEG